MEKDRHMDCGKACWGRSEIVVIRIALLSVVLISTSDLAAAQVSNVSPTPEVQQGPAIPPTDRAEITYAFHSKLPRFHDKTSGGTAIAAGLGVLSGGVLEAALAGGVVGAAQGATSRGPDSADVFPNPENLIAAEIAKRASQSLNAVQAAQPTDFDSLKLEGSPAQKYKMLAGSSRYVVDVKTEIFQSVWASYATWPLDFSHYILEYMGFVTVYDTQASKELAAGRCFVFTKRTPEVPTHEQLFANKGEILKKDVREAADDCVAQLVEKNEKFRTLLEAKSAS